MVTLLAADGERKRDRIRGCGDVIYKRNACYSNSHSVRGMEMMTPFPVPIHRRLHDTMRAVILTNEKPSFPVPEKKAERTQCQVSRLGFQEDDVLFSESELTQHLADVRLDVDVLKVLEGVSVEQPEGGVQSDGHPDTVAVPCQLTYLAVFTRMGVK